MNFLFRSALKKRILASVVIAVLSCLAVAPLYGPAVNYQWTAGAACWSNAGSWSPCTGPPTASDNVNFTDCSCGAANVNLGMGFYCVNDLNLNAPTDVYTIRNGTIQSGCTVNITFFTVLSSPVFLISLTMSTMLPAVLVELQVMMSPSLET